MAESIVKIKLQADTTGLSQLDSIFATTGSKFVALTKIQELANSLSLERGRLEKINVSILADQSKQLETIKNSVANVKLKEILSNQVLKDNKANLDALAGSISNVSNRLKELELSKKQFTAIDATKRQAIKPQPFSLGLSTTVQQYKEILETQKRIQEENDKIPPKLKPWANSLAELIIRYRAINFVYNQFLNALYNIPKVGIQLESTTASLTATFGSAVAAQRELQFLTQESLRTGIAVGTLREQYASASASFIAAGESAETTRKIFQNVNVVATTLHLSSDRVSSVYLALSQIFNKTKLQAEELTKQLSQTIPGVTNQQAKALGITVSDLYDRMKKGAISAHEAVLALSETLGQTFGGDAFTTATSGLNAELGRLQTSWTLFTESLYRASEGAMKSVVKSTTEIVNWFTDAVSGTDFFSNSLTILNTTLTAVASGLVAVKLAEFTVLLGEVATATATVNKAMLTLWATIKAHPLAIFTGAIAGAITYLDALNTKTEESRKKVDDLVKMQRIARGEITEGTLTTGQLLFKETARYKEIAEGLVSVGKDIKEVKDAAANLAILKGTPFEVSEADLAQNVKYKELLQKQFRLQDLQRLEEAKFRKEIGETTKKSIYDDYKEREKFEILQAENSGDAVKKARLSFMKTWKDELEGTERKYRDALAAGDEQKAREAARNFEIYAEGLEKAGMDAAEKASKKADKGMAGKANQAYRTDLQETKASFEQYKTDIASTLGVLDNLYQESQLSIEEYFNRKLALQKDDISVQRQMLESEKALAVAKGDTTKAAQLDYEIRKLNTQTTKEEFESQKDLTKALREYKDTIEEIKAAELSAQGKGGEGLVEKFKVQYADVYKQATLTNDTDTLKLLKNRELTLKLTGDLNNLDTERQLSQQKYNLELDKINTKVSAGTIGQFQAMGELTKANEDYLKVKEEEYSKMLQFIREVEAGKGTVPAKDRLEAEQMNNEIEKMKLSANEFANYFQKTVGDGFANAFTEFATGAATAKEAFRDMALSISKDLAKMAAQEAATQLLTNVLKPLGGAAWSGVTSLFAADGAAVAGMSSVSGSVLSSATYFPSAKPVAFASGGVVAGEAGAEAVLPLKRNKYGKLGVALENSGQSNSNVYNISVNVQSSANDTPSGTGEKVAVSIMRAIAKEEISSASRSGNFKAARSM